MKILHGIIIYFKTCYILVTLIKFIVYGDFQWEQNILNFKVYHTLHSSHWWDELSNGRRFFDLFSLFFQCCWLSCSFWDIFITLSVQSPLHLTFYFIFFYFPDVSIFFSHFFLFIKRFLTFYLYICFHFEINFIMLFNIFQAFLRN